MTIEILVPHLPESVADATVVVWHKQQGDRVEKGENLIDLETDKVVLEVPALETGILSEIIKKEGAIVEAMEVLALLEPVNSSTSMDVKAEEPAPKRADVDDTALSPAVRRLIHEHHLNPSDIKGTGKQDRIIKADVLDFLAQQKEKEAAVDKIIITTSTNSQILREKPAVTSPLVVEDGLRPEQRVPMTRLRAKVAERLLQAQQNAAMLTTFNEVNMDAVMTLRRQYQARFQEKHGIKLGFMSFFVKASIEALKKFPAINASIDESDILYHGYYDIGIAVTSPRGLVVPVVKDADQLDFAGIEKSINGFGLKAREGTLSYDDLKGGTFTITNGGIFGSMLSTPILNPPQCAILGMHGIKDRPVVEEGKIVIRPMMYLALSYDHRLVDGREAVQFLVMIKECLESPAHLLLNI
ncbi:MAG: 2-oxoglutarate dehydrogenase complex dihydrolipoyllysine-residue succinyltransferase [Methylococcales bacterium]|nr:2-oxoglutarate dehydrogenase complex dihydrolipoyllysine-residue succinyltransferase [Methylococcales bacterium]MCK5924754.1 2-oxoglutarate dehydrogenase complex dihydrolipoyllysine-residue succinyltransferase [Methylococcales bacterium]